MYLTFVQACVLYCTSSVYNTFRSSFLKCHKGNDWNGFKMLWRCFLSRVSTQNHMDAFSLPMMLWSMLVYKAAGLFSSTFFHIALFEIRFFMITTWLESHSLIFDFATFTSSAAKSHCSYRASTAEASSVFLTVLSLSSSRQRKLDESEQGNEGERQGEKERLKARRWMGQGGGGRKWMQGDMGDETRL